MKRIVEESRIKVTLMELMMLPYTEKERKLIKKYERLFFNEKRIRVKNKYGNNLIRIRNRAFKRMFKKINKTKRLVLLQSMNRNKSYNMDVRREVEVKSFLNRIREKVN